jgi:hypothetical protein
MWVAPTGLFVWLATVLLPGAGLDAAPVGVGAICTAYDLELVTRIEDHALVGSTAPSTLAAAAFAILDARTACLSGDIDGAVRLYEAIPLGRIGMSPFHRMQMW